MLSKANVRGALAGLGLAGGLVLAGSSCHQSIMTAPPGSTITMVANPGFIPAFGGVSVITAVVYDGTGQPVADGTVVQFFTDLGRVDEQGRTNDGVAKVNLVADGRSGKATVTGIIGGGVIPTPSGTGGATPTPTPSTNSASGALAGGATTADAGAAASTTSTTSTASASASVPVTIGTALPKSVLLSADPRNISPSAPRYTTLTATVFGDSGNPIANIPVVFSIITRSDPDFSESLESGGRPVFTDTNGQARDRLFTSVPRDARSQSVEVEAVVVVGSDQLTSNSVIVGINY